MVNKGSYKKDKEAVNILLYIFEDTSKLFMDIAPDGWINSEYIHFFHPTPDQQYEEHKILTDNLNNLKKGGGKKKNYADKNDFKQDDLKEVKEYEEFLYVVGLAVYDIFSNNHEVIASDNKIYDLGSLRGSGHFIADLFNYNLDSLSNKYDYMDFYMGSIWIRSRANLLPFYEFVFKKLKSVGCNWKYAFPRMYLMNPKKLFDDPKQQDLENYSPESAVTNELDMNDEGIEQKKFREELDRIYEEEYEEAKYKPLNKIVQAYKNIYGVLPEGHPQKGFE